jgi:hypothetical protein
MLRQKRLSRAGSQGDVDIQLQSGPGTKFLAIAVSLCLIVLVAALSQNMPALSSLAANLTGELMS